MNKETIDTSLYIKDVKIEKDKLIKAIKDNPKEAYLLNIPSIKQITSEGLKFNSKVTFFVGENGSGKSTLIEAIASSIGFNPEGGDKFTLFKTKNTHSILSNYIITSKSGKQIKDGYFLRAESFYNVASYLYDAGSFDDPSKNRFGENLHEISHGEAFLALVSNRFTGNGIYILDEPEAALSPSKLMSLMCHMRELEKTSQFIISTHSPILMSYPGADIFELSEKGINKVDYKQTEHYHITKGFIDKPEVMFKHLFDEDSF